MTGLGDVVGQEGALATLRRLLATGRVPHALLFRGPDAVGKALAARAFAAALVCEAPRPEACGACRACRLAGQDGHPDVITIRREPKRAGRSRAVEEDEDEPGEAAPRESELSSVVRVDQIREMNRLAGHAPRLGRRRVFVVDPADRMNLESQNALLKTLEEPPGATVVILVAARPHLLLPTVRSRCFAVAFSAMRTAELTRLLEGRGLVAAEASARAALSEGRPGFALTLDLEELSARRDGLARALEELTKPRPALAELGALASSLAGRDEETLVAGLDLLESAWPPAPTARASCTAISSGSSHGSADGSAPSAAHGSSRRSSVPGVTCAATPTARSSPRRCSRRLRAHRCREGEPRSPSTSVLARLQPVEEGEEEAGRPSAHQDPRQPFDTGQQSPLPRREQIAVADRGIGHGAEVEGRFGVGEDAAPGVEQAPERDLHEVRDDDPRREADHPHDHRAEREAPGDRMGRQAAEREGQHRAVDRDARGEHRESDRQSQQHDRASRSANGPLRTLRAARDHSALAGLCSWTADRGSVPLWRPSTSTLSTWAVWGNRSKGVARMTR
jgi:DNA polymerase-3 subunit delta'